MTSHDERLKEGQNKKNENQPKEQKMKLKTKIAVVVLALTATTSPVWSQDRQALPSPTAQTLRGTWRITITEVDCITGQGISSFPAIRTFNQGGTCTGYVVPPGIDPGQGTEYGVWQREPGSQNYSVRTVSYGYTAEGVFDGTAEVTETLHLTGANSFEGSATVQIFNADGNLLFTACTTSTGTRFQ